MLVPGEPNTDDIKLSDYLDIPILSGNPSQNALISRLSTTKELFKECGFPLPPFSSLILKPADVVPQLSRLIAENAHVDRWVFKINGEFEGRGIAYFDVTRKIKSFLGVKKLHTICKDIRCNQTEEDFAEIQRVLSKVLPKKISYANPCLYSDYFQFIEEFCRQGGIVEASPSSLSKDVSSPGVVFQIDPDGEVEIQTTFEKIISSPFSPCGMRFPQRSLPNLNVRFAYL